MHLMYIPMLIQINKIIMICIHIPPWDISYYRVRIYKHIMSTAWMHRHDPIYIFLKNLLMESLVLHKIM